MRTVRSILTVVLSLGFLVAQLPAPAQCQMGLLSSLTMRCSMPCCKKMANTAKCPMVKKVAPRDAIASAVPQFTITLKEVALQPAVTQAPVTGHPRFHTVVQILQRLFLLTVPLASRAPPHDVVTFQA